MKSVLVYSVREWLPAIEGVIDRNYQDSLRLVANGMRPLQLFAYQDQVWYRTEGYEIYLVDLSSTGARVAEPTRIGGSQP